MRTKRIYVLGLTVAMLAASTPVAASDRGGAPHDGYRPRAGSPARREGGRRMLRRSANAARRPARRLARRPGLLRRWGTRVGMLGAFAAVAVGAHALAGESTAVVDLATTPAVATHAPRYTPAEGAARALRPGEVAFGAETSGTTKVVLYHRDGQRWTSKTVNAPFKIDGAMAKSVTITLTDGLQTRVAIAKAYPNHRGASPDKRLASVEVNLGTATAKTLEFSNVFAPP